MVPLYENLNAYGDNFDPLPTRNPAIFNDLQPALALTFQVTQLRQFYSTTLLHLIRRYLT